MRRLYAPAAPLFVWILAVAAILTLLAAGSPTATSAPPPTPVPPLGSPSPFPTVLVTPPSSATPPELISSAAVLEDLDTGQILHEKAPRARRPAASLTKIMTALVVLESVQLSEIVTAGPDAVAQEGASLGLEVGEQRSVRELLYALLLQSSNDAAVALADHVAGSVPAFVEMMNRRAAQMALRDTRFESATGLDNDGYSTAEDLAQLTRTALADPTFAEVVRTKARNIPAPSGPDRHIQNRNVLLWLYPGAIGVKTGFTTPAGHCLVAAANRGGLRLLAVTLGAPTEPFDDGATLLNFGFAGFRRVTLVAEGDAVGLAAVGGLPVPGVAAAGLERLVRVDPLGTVRREFRPFTGLELPIVAGDGLGWEVIFVGGVRVGTVRVVAGRSVSAPTASPPRTSPPPEPEPNNPVGVAERLALAAFRALAAAFL